MLIVSPDIGNARIAGLDEDLHLSSAQYEWLLTAFYITYIVFEWMTLMYRLVPAHIYIPLCVFSWGVAASLQCLATSFGGLVTLRFILGITEAAFGPGVPFYLSLFYRRQELAFRNGLFISAAPLATSFASSLAWVIVRLSSNGPIAPWRTLFLVEGFPSVIVAVFAWVLIPDSPGRARFLNRRQRVVARLRLGESKSEYQNSHGKRFDWREIIKTASDPKAYMAAVSLNPDIDRTELTMVPHSLCFSAAMSPSAQCPCFFLPLLKSEFSLRVFNLGLSLIIHPAWATPPSTHKPSQHHPTS